MVKEDVGAPAEVPDGAAEVLLVPHSSELPVEVEQRLPIMEVRCSIERKAIKIFDAEAMLRSAMLV